MSGLPGMAKSPACTDVSKTTQLGVALLQLRLASEYTRLRFSVINGSQYLTCFDAVTRFDVHAEHSAWNLGRQGALHHGFNHTIDVAEVGH